MIALAGVAAIAAQTAAAAATAHPLAGTAAGLMWLLPLLPLLGFLANGVLSLAPVYFVGPKDPSRTLDAGHTDSEHVAEHDRVSDAEHRRFHGVSSVVGVLAVGLSFALAVAIFFASRGDALLQPFVQTYGEWIPAGDLQVSWAFQLDRLSLLMVLVITGIGTLIHIFSVGYMREDQGYSRYFAYLNLFVFFMLVLVLGASYLVLFVGWEGVGLCSYLLIGFWFDDAVNADAGKKAFVVNRIGDFGFLVAMFLIFANLGTLDFAEVNARAGQLQAGGALVTAICLFLFLGCAGKSAQMPLFVWLPAAMAGPTPVSALIHAATMVTAGVYLIARSSALFALAPTASLFVALVGAVTALFAATIGLKQWDIKRVLAYSTVSQLGYMFIAAGVGAYTAGVFHLVTHAFFKALLFLGAGSVIYAMHAAFHHTGRHDDAQDMRNMGGLRKAMPVTMASMWIATLAIAGIPPFAGFFSKDEILGTVFARAQHSPLADATLFGVPGRVWLYIMYAFGLITAFLTAIYMTRMMLYTFHGANRTGEAEREHLHEAPWVMTVPVAILAVLSVAGGWINLPELIPAGPVGALADWLDPVVGRATRLLGGDSHLSHSTELVLVGLAIATAVLGVLFAFIALKPARLTTKAAAPAEHGFGRVLANAYFVDEGYDATMVNPTVNVSRAVLWRGMDVGVIDGVFVNGAATLTRGIAWAGSRLQSGNVGAYAWVIALGVLVIVGVIIR